MIGDSIKTVLESYGPLVVDKMKEELAKNGSIASSKLYNSLKWEVKQDVDKWILSFKSEDYAKFVEVGRRAGAKKVPISKLREWVKYKGIPENKVWGIQTNIFKFGIKPKPFIKPAFDQYKDDIIRAILKDIKSETLDKFKREMIFTLKKK